MISYNVLDSLGNGIHTSAVTDINPFRKNNII